MDEKADSLLRKILRLLARIWVWLPLAIAVLAVVVLITLPYGIRYATQRWLVSQGASQAQVEDVDFNPFLRRLAVRNVQVKVDGVRTLLVSQASFRYELIPLLHKQVVIKDVYLRDASLTIEKKDDGSWRFIGVFATHPASTKPQEEKSVWGFMLQRVEINNGELRYKSAVLNGTARIDHGELIVQSRPGADKPVVDGAQIRIDGQLHVEHAKPNLVADTRVSANIKATPPPEKSGSWRLAGTGKLHDINVGWPDGGLRVVSAKQLDVAGLEVDGGDRIAIRTLGIEQLAIAQSTAQEELPPALSAGMLQATEIRFVPEKTLDIAKISAGGLHIVARHNTKHRWYGFNQLLDLKRSQTTPAEPAPPLVVRIGSIVLGDPGLIELSDLTVKPAFQTRLTVTNAQMTGLDTSPSPAQPGRLALSTRVGKYTTTELSAKFHTFAPKLSTDLQVKVREFELPALSAYAIKMLGYRILSGKLDSDIDLKIVNEHLEGLNKNTLKEFALKRVNDASAEQLEARLTMPLESALAMLRDKHNNVHLEVILSGNMSDPKFDLTDIINQALTKALRTASVSYLKYFFQPYGTLITVAELAGKALQLRLDPVPFAPGESTPTSTAQDYLAKVGTLLGERPKLRLKLCGKAVMRDKLTEEAAKTLASRRAEVLKDYFANQHGIAIDRLFLCDPELDQDAEALPRVELVL